jgi:GxxExxY protein
MAADVAQMNVLQDRDRLNAISGKVIGAGQRVSSRLGYGFLEKVYENALCYELRKRSLIVHQQMPLQVTYDGLVVGDYVPDLLVEDSVIVEMKAVGSISKPHRQQCLNYLRAANLSLGLILNFGHAHLEVGRVVYRF